MSELPYDPKLKAVMKQMREIAQAYDVFIVCQIMSPTHGEVLCQWPSWSGVQAEGDDRVRIRMKGEERTKWDATAHIVASTVVWSERMFKNFSGILHELSKKALIGLPRCEITPHRPEMDPQ